MYSHLQPIETAVSNEAEGQDCVNAWFGIGFGTNTIEKAMQNGYPKPVTKIRSVELNTFQVAFITGQCLIVHGETGLTDKQLKHTDNLGQWYYPPQK